MKQQAKSTTTTLYRKDKQKMKLTTSNKSGTAIKFDADARREYLLGMGKRKVERQVVARELKKLKEGAALQEQRKQNRMQDKKLWDDFEAKMKQEDEDENEEEMDEVGMVIKKEDANSAKVVDYQRNTYSNSSEEEEEEEEETMDSDDEEVTSVRVTVQPMNTGNANLLQIMNEKEEIAQEVHLRKQQLKEEQHEQLEQELALQKAKHFMNQKTHLKAIPGISQLKMTAEELDKKVMEFKKEQKMKKITIQAKAKMNKSGKKRSKMLQKIKNKRKSKE